MLRLSYDRISESFRGIGSYAVFAADPPWTASSNLFPHPADAVTIVKDLDRETLDGYTRSCPDSDYIVGLGGGTAIDAAKYVACYKSGAKPKLVLVPSTVSVNAFMSPEIAVRIEGIVNYQGPIFADLILVDIPLIRSAPPRLNRAGVGDIYSARTSLVDWETEHKTSQGWFDEEVFSKTTTVLKRLKEKARDIYDVTEEGIKVIVQSNIEIAEVVKILEQKGRPKNKTWPADGIEHIFFYSLEKFVDRPLIHGEIVGLGAVVGTHVQGGDVDSVIEDLDSFGLQFRPTQIGISFDEFKKAILSMKDVSRSMGYSYLSLQGTSPDSDDVAFLWEKLA